MNYLSISQIKTTLNNILGVFLLFLYIFGIPFNFLPINTSKLVFPILFILYVFKISRRNIFITPPFSFYIASLIILLLAIISFLVTLLHGNAQIIPAYSYLIMFLEGICGTWLFYVVFLEDKTPGDFWKQIQILAFIQSVIILSMFLIADFRAFVFSITETEASEVFLRFGGFRGLGLAASLTYDLSIFLALALFSIFFYSPRTISGKLLASFASVIVIIATAMTGRSGLYLFLLAPCFFLCFKHNIPQLRRGISLFIFILLYLLAISFFIIFAFPDFAKIINELILPFAFEPIYRFLEQGEFTTKSAIHLHSMYFPINELTFLFGDGKWNNPDGTYYLNTDAGFMRHTLFYGIFPSILLYVSFILSIIFLYLRQHSKTNKSLIILMLITFFAGHYKGDFFMGSSMNIKLFFLVFWMYSGKWRDTYSLLNLPKQQFTKTTFIQNSNRC